MKKLFSTTILCLCISALSAQITIMEAPVQERVVSKPQSFDSLSNITVQKDPIQYKKYVGYKLFCLPLSKKFQCKYSDCTFYLQNFKYKSSEAATDIYNAVYSEKVPDQNKYYTPYESIQNTYFTILNIEIGDKISKGQFYSLEEWKNPYKKTPDACMLRLTLKNETSGEEIYFETRSSYLSNSYMFLVPYFEKMQKTYKGKKVVATTEIPNLVDVERGNAITIKAGEEWNCYEVTFVNLEDEQIVKPYFFLEKDGSKTMVKFSDFTQECNGIFTKDDYIRRPTFMLAEDFNEIVAAKQRAAEEQKRLEEERQREEEMARQEHEKRIMQKFGNKYGPMICRGEVCLNMTKEMCLEAWGEPLEVNTTIVQGLVHEQWVYGWQTYLYFDNGILKAIQN